MMSMAWTTARLNTAWRLPLATSFGLLLLILAAYQETGAAMVEIWIRSPTFTHAFVVPPIVAWLIWRKRAALAAMQPQPAPWLLVPMAGFALVWWLGKLVNVAAAMQLAFVAMLVVAVPLSLGWQVARAIAFPLLFSFFAVPIGEFLTPTLMHWTVEVLVSSLRMTGIPVYQEGQQLVIPSGRWAVVAACSGIRYLMATFMVGSLFAYLNYSSLRKRLIFVGISLVLPVLANWVRAYIIVMLGHLSNNEIATGVDHIVYGWVFFGVVILVLFFVGARWADPELPASPARAMQRGTQTGSPRPLDTWVPIATLVAAVLSVSWPMALHQGTGQSSAIAVAPVRLALPEALGVWRGEPLRADAWVPFFATANVHPARVYVGPKGAVTVHVAYYRGQGGDVKLVSSANRWVEDESHSRWRVLSDRIVQAGIEGSAADWRQAILLPTDAGPSASGPQQRLTVWRLYWIGGRLAQGDVRAKLLQAEQALLGEQDDGAAVHLATDLLDDEAARQVLQAFIAENFSTLKQLLEDARKSR